MMFTEVLCVISPLATVIIMSLLRQVMLGKWCLKKREHEGMNVRNYSINSSHDSFEILLPVALR